MTTTHLILFKFLAGATAVPEIAWVLPTAGDHPRLHISNRYGPTVSTFQARIAGAHAPYWNSLLSWCASRAGYADSYFTSYDSEYTAAFALAYLLDNTKISYGNKAASIALYMANNPTSNETAKRRQLLAMAMAYDWAYDRITSTNRATIRSRIAAYCNDWKVPGSTEFMQGHGGGNLCHALAALPAILEDGSSGDNDTWEGYMDTCLTSWSSGNDATSVSAPFRYFGNTDGGSYRGGGSHSYSTYLKWWQTKFFPTLKTALDFDLSVYDAWYWLQGYWKLWHWREDDALGHWSGEAFVNRPYAIQDMIYALQVHSREPTTDYGKAMGWLAYKMQLKNSDAIWGPYHIWNILYRHESLVPSGEDPPTGIAEPTVANFGKMRVFRNARLVSMKTGWSENDSTLVLQGHNFMGGHTCPGQAGSFSLSGYGSPIVVRHGHYDPNQATTYQRLGTYDGSTERTGHRYTYYNRDLAYACCLIYDSDEPSENRVESFQRLISSSFYFGRYDEVLSNIGGKLWPKDLVGAKYQPDNFAHYYNEPKWNFETFPVEPIETSQYCYAVVNLLPWFYASKCTRYRRHVLHIAPSRIHEDFPFPIYLIWDDMTTHIDATYDNKTQQFVMTTVVPHSDLGSGWLLWARERSKLFFKMLRPSVARQMRTGFFDLDEVYYRATNSPDGDDSNIGVYTTRFYPTVATTQPGFCAVMVPMSYSWDVSDIPSFELLEDATWIGLTFPDHEITVKIKKGDTHEVDWVTSTPPIPPPPPPPPPPPGTPSTNNNLRSAVGFPFILMMPYPYADSVNFGDQVQSAGFYRDVTISVPPPEEPAPGTDEVAGAAITCTSEPQTGEAIGCAGSAVTGGAIDDDGTPDTGEAI